MSEISHTPGPWTMWNRNKSDYIILGPHNGHGSPEVANVNGYIEFTDEENKANAKLIAAAPDMFDIIKELYEWAQDTQTFGPIYPKLEAAYLKATK
jgi:hypothetical protein